MTPQEWFAEFCRRMSWPGSAANVAILNQWATNEGMFNPAGLAFTRGYNPFMTTQGGYSLSKEDLGFGPGLWNRQGVKMYADAESGLQATVQTFLAGTQWYKPLIDAFKAQTWTPDVGRAWQIWIFGPNADPSNHDYDVSLSAYARATWGTSTTVPAAPPPDPLEDLILALFAGREQPGDRATRLAYARSVLADSAAGNSPSVKEIAASALALAASRTPNKPHRHSFPSGFTSSAMEESV